MPDTRKIILIALLVGAAAAITGLLVWYFSSKSSGCTGTSPCSAQCPDGVCSGNDVCLDGQCVPPSQIVVFSIDDLTGNFAIACEENGNQALDVQFQVTGLTPNSSCTFYYSVEGTNEWYVCNEPSTATADQNGQLTALTQSCLIAPYSGLCCTTDGCAGQTLYIVCQDNTTNVYSNTNTVQGACQYPNGCC